MRRADTLGVMLLLLANLTALACDDSVEVVAVSPQNGSYGVPTDTEVVLHLRGQGDLDVDDIALLGPSGPVPGSWENEPAEAGHSSVWRFTPASSLSPETPYLLDVAGEDSVEHHEVYPDAGWGAGFVTGLGAARPLDGIPGLQLADVGQAMEGTDSRCEPVGFRRVAYRFSPLEVDRPAEHWFLLKRVTADSTVLLDARRLDARDWSDEAEVLVPDDGPSFCMVGVHRGPSGVEAESDVVCFEAETLSEDQVAYYGGSRCSTTGTGVLGLWSGVLLLAARRRRGRCG